MQAGSVRKVAWLPWTVCLILATALALVHAGPALSLQQASDDATADVTLTWTPTPPESISPTATPDPSITPTETPEESLTPEETATATATPDGTWTVTPTPEATTDPDATPTEEPPTATPTPDLSATLTATLDPSISPSPTEEPTITPTETPTPTATPRSAALPLVWRQVRRLLNGGLESGEFVPGWQIGGNLPAAVVRSERHSGVFAARLGNPNFDSAGGCPTGSASIGQVIDVPATLRSTLHFWYCIYSYDTIDFDYFAVTITRGDSGETRSVWLDGRTDWSPQLWSSGWQHGTVSLDAYSGQAVTVRFYNVLSNEDGWYNTWTLLDDVSVNMP